jgi:hypothetical protein
MPKGRYFPKMTSGIIVLFNAAAYESRAAVRTIKRGAADVETYRFSHRQDDTKYKDCRVSYTDTSGNTFEGIFTPPNPPADGKTLEINEKVSSNEQARRRAMLHLRAKNKGEITAEITLLGDASLVTGVTVMVKGWGLFDGKYFVETAGHAVTNSGYKVNLKLRRCLEGY